MRTIATDELRGEGSLGKGIPCGRVLLFVCLLASGAGCTTTLEVQVIRYPWTEQPKLGVGECAVRVYGQGDLPGCIEFGDVFVGDTGWTHDCGLDRMLGEVRTQACRYGADAAQVIRIQNPSLFGSSCHEVRAKFLKCPAPS